MSQFAEKNKEMAMAMVRAGLLRAAIRGGYKNPSVPRKRGFASSGHQDEHYEAEKWEKITYAGIATCAVLAYRNLSKDHPHFEEPPPYQYLHVRSKEFPWGPDGLFETKQPWSG